MADYSIWVLGADSITVSGGETLGNPTQGDGSHLVGETLTFEKVNSREIFISDAGVETNFADNDAGQTLNGAQELDGTTYADGTIIEAEYTLVLIDDTTGLTYTVYSINIRNSSPSYATVEGLAFVEPAPPPYVPLRVLSASEGPPNGSANAVDESEIVPICFAGGTRIATPDGVISVEHLGEGDLVMRADGTPVPVRRVFCATFAPADIARNPRLSPVRITAGALGAGLPLRDLLVSRQHRMLVSSKVAERMFGEREVLIPAIRLTELPGIYVDDAVTCVAYYHLLFDAHEVILAEGAPSESLFLGKQALLSVMPAAREEILMIFPQVADADFLPVPAMSIPTNGQQRRLVARHAKNGKPPLELFRPRG